MYLLSCVCSVQTTPVITSSSVESRQVFHPAVVVVSGDSGLYWNFPASRDDNTGGVRDTAGIPVIIVMSVLTGYTV